MKKPKRSGRLTKSEWDFIERNSDKMTAAELAEKMDRDIGPIRNYLQKIGKSKNKKAALETQAEYDLKGRPYWKELKAQFSVEELDMFLYHWKQIIAQFRRDVMSTEEMQIIDLVKLEILMNRALRSQQESIETVHRLERQLKAEEKLGTKESKEMCMSLMRQIASLNAAKESLGKDYKELQGRKSSMFKDLKATREQRVQKLESNKTTFAGLVSRLVGDPDFFEECGREMELMRSASSAARNQLHGYHTFGDGQIDRVVLNATSVMGDDDGK